ICKDTFEACGDAIVLKLKASPKPCSEHDNQAECETAGCYWYGEACHEYGPVVCSDYTDALTCVANNCYWWTDGTCHSESEEVPKVIEVHSSETFNGFEVELPNGTWKESANKWYYTGSWTGSGERYNVNMQFNIKVDDVVVYNCPSSFILFEDKKKTYDLSEQNITDAAGNKLESVTFKIYDFYDKGTYSKHFYSFKTSVEITPVIEKKDTITCYTWAYAVYFTFG
ncbi:unnamed protein product, partial [marine sediment metagenome]